MYTKELESALSEIRKALAYGDVKKISEKLHVTSQHIHNVLNGKYNDDEVIEQAIRLITERREHTLQKAEYIMAAIKR